MNSFNTIKGHYKNLSSSNESQHREKRNNNAKNEQIFFLIRVTCAFDAEEEGIRCIEKKSFHHLNKSLKS